MQGDVEDLPPQLVRGGRSEHHLRHIVEQTAERRRRTTLIRLWSAPSSGVSLCVTTVTAPFLP
jgi:hypothetical protein